MKRLAYPLVLVFLLCIWGATVHASPNNFDPNVVAMKALGGFLHPFQLAIKIANRIKKQQNISEKQSEFYDILKLDTDATQLDDTYEYELSRKLAAYFNNRSDWKRIEKLIAIVIHNRAIAEDEKRAQEFFEKRRAEWEKEEHKAPSLNELREQQKEEEEMEEKMMEHSLEMGEAIESMEREEARELAEAKAEAALYNLAKGVNAATKK